MNKRLDHLGIVADVRPEIGLANYLDTQAGNKQQQVSIGTITIAMLLNSLGFSNRRVNLVPKFHALHALCLTRDYLFFTMTLIDPAGRNVR